MGRDWKEEIPVCSPRPSFPSPRLSTAHLFLDQLSGGPHGRAAVPSAVINMGTTPTLQRTANSVREAGEVLAASFLWLVEVSRQSSPRAHALFYVFSRIFEAAAAAKQGDEEDAGRGRK